MVKQLSVAELQHMSMLINQTLEVREIENMKLYQWEAASPWSRSPSPRANSTTTTGSFFVMDPPAPEKIDKRCYCGEPVVILVTRREGRNFGRKFRRCANWMLTEKRCAFFQWLEVQDTWQPTKPGWKNPGQQAPRTPLLTPEKGQAAPPSCSSQRTGPTSPMKTPPAFSSTMGQTTTSKETCQHSSVTHAGSNKFVVVTKCRLCGETLEHRAPQGGRAASAKDSQVGTNRHDHAESCRQDSRRSPSDTRSVADAELPFDTGSSSGSRGVRSLPGVPEVPEYAEGPRWVPEEVRRLSPHQKRQFAGQLKDAERRWTVMEQCLLAEGSGLAAPGQKDDGSSGTMSMSKKQKKRMQHELHVMDTVAEVFNPERFSKRAARFRLKPGRAFDLALGHDLLKLSNQQSILDYINHERPGLVIVSPPCNAFSSLNNLLMKFRQRNIGALKKYIKALDMGKKLLNFAMKVCELCHSLQISFVFEHPQTARSWQERSVRRLTARPGIHRVVAHQCQFGLRSKDQRPHKKPTAFLTNHKGLAERLQRRCQGGHVHEHIIGDRRRSAAAQIYPDGLVDAVLETYSRSVGKAPAEICLCQSSQVILEDQRRDQLYFLRDELEEIEVNLADHVPAARDEVFANEELPRADGEINEVDEGVQAVIKDLLPETYGVTEAQAAVDGWTLVKDQIWINAVENSREIPAPEADHPAAQFPWRSSWVNQNGQWRLLEDEVRWSGLASPPRLQRHDRLLCLYQAKLDQRQQRRLRHFPGMRQVTLEQMVRRAHEGLGHPETSRFLRILRQSKVDEEAIKTAKDLKCSTCAAFRLPDPARRAAPPREESHINERVGLDVVHLRDHENRTVPSLNVIDWGTHFQLMFP